MLIRLHLVYGRLEVFRSHLEAAMNDLLKIELTQFLGYEIMVILIRLP